MSSKRLVTSVQLEANLTLQAYYVGHRVGMDKRE